MSADQVIPMPIPVPSVIPSPSLAARAQPAADDRATLRRLVLTFCSTATVVLAVLLSVPAGSPVLAALGVTAVPLAAGAVAAGAMVLVRARAGVDRRN